MKKGQFALFSYLALVLSFSFVLFFTIKAYNGIKNYKFHVESKYKEFYLETINLNFEISLLNPLFGFFFYHLFSFEKKDKDPFKVFFYHKGKEISCTDLLAMDSKFYNEEYREIKSCLEEKEKEDIKLYLQNLNYTLNNYFPSSWNSYFLDYITKNSKMFEENVQKKFLFFNFGSDYKVNSFILVRNSVPYLVNCYYRKYLDFSLPYFYFGKRISKIPLECCVYHKIKGECSSALPYFNRVCLDNLDNYLTYLVFNTDLESYSKDISFLKEEPEFLQVYFTPEVIKNLTSRGFAFLNKEALNNLKNGFKFGNVSFWIVGNYLIVKNKSLKIYYLDPFQKKIKD